MRTSNAFNLGMVALLAACTAALGPLAMFKLYFVPYWVNVVWLDVVTYLHHHGPQDAGEKVPWYRGKVPSSLSGVQGLQYRGTDDQKVPRSCGKGPPPL